MSSGDASPISYRSKADGAYLELRRRILVGKVAAGSFLNQEQLAADLGVSTTPLREALRRLESEGLVVVAPHKDVQVAPLDPDEVHALYDVRVVLDALAARLAAQHHDEQDRIEMERACAELLRAKDPIVANRAFHASVYESCHNDVLITLLDSLWDRSDRFRRAIREYVVDPSIVESHSRLLELILKRDAKAAAAEMARHIREAQQALETAVSAGAPAAQPAAGT